MVRALACQGRVAHGGGAGIVLQAVWPPLDHHSTRTSSTPGWELSCSMALRYTAFGLTPKYQRRYWAPAATVVSAIPCGARWGERVSCFREVSARTSKLVPAVLPLIAVAAFSRLEDVDVNRTGGLVPSASEAEQAGLHAAAGHDCPRQVNQQAGASSTGSSMQLPLGSGQKGGMTQGAACPHARHAAHMQPS